ncbi:MAG TPA: helix-turn-helix domain-containing protein [Gemmatimonadales bacterium]|nr:helix-turn-helix domain-containing protein [Gemmatimonadales bacterium]
MATRRYRKKPRKYQKKRRAEQEAETRQRIVEAMVDLHREVGPARTTISAIAERAGVERLTVYRHFPDERSMFEACTTHYATQVPQPDPAAWAGIEAPAERLRGALLEFYRYYRQAEEMLANATRDVPQLPALAAVLRPRMELVERMRKDLVERWDVAGPARARLAAAIGHALRFDSWRSLARTEGLNDRAAADLMVDLASSAAAFNARGAA